MKLLFENWRKFTENIDLDIEVGDVLLGGKYKNKRIVVKDIGKDELGQPTVNGDPILKVRIEKHLPDSKKSKKTLEAEKEELKEATTNSKLGKKNRSVDVTTTSDLADKIAPDVATVIKNSYSALGGFPGAETPEGVKHQFTNFYVSDVDEDPEVDIAIAYHDRGGATKKASAIATDGGSSAKKEIRSLMSELFKKPGFWIEVSGAPANIAIKKLNLPFVNDPELAEWLVSFGGKRETGIKWLGSDVSDNLGADGWYSRPLQGKNTTKIIVGNVTREIAGLK